MNLGEKRTPPKDGLPFTASARSVFRMLYAGGPATRPQLCESLGLSRPTMSAAVGDLHDVGFVEKIGEVQGATGRKAGMYRLAPGAGHVISIDAGSSHIRIRATGLDKRILYSRTAKLPINHERLDPEISAAVASEFDKVLEVSKPGWGPLRALGVALPCRIVDHNNPVRETTGQETLYTNFTPPSGLPLILENNVNCAAIAEHSHGVARDVLNFAYIQIGLKIGMGVYLNGQLIRGMNGAAGEIGHLPFPWAPETQPKPEELEYFMGADALMARVRDDWPAGPSEAKPPEGTIDLLELAEQGNSAALHHVEQHAADIGAIAAACVSTIDPGLVVLGGGIGSSELLLPRVRQEVERLSYQTRIESSSLGADATVLGMERLTADYVCDELMGKEFI